MREFPDLVHELTTEKRVVSENAQGFKVVKWNLKHGEKNDYGDTLKMLVGQGYLLKSQIARMWARMDEGERRKAREWMFCSPLA